MHKTESILENETHKIHWGFEIQMDQLISARRLDLVLTRKKNLAILCILPFLCILPSCVFCRFGGIYSENKKDKNKTKHKYLDLVGGGEL